MTDLTFFREILSTPTGPMAVVTDAGGCLRALDWVDCEERMMRLLRRHYGAQDARFAAPVAASSARRQLEAYFDGALNALDAVETATAGTAFQRAVWQALRRIPIGQTRSYGGLAAAIGKPGAMRAVGLANGANPIAIVVPCHRVIGADGRLTGYAGGVARKLWLLEHEGAPVLRAPV